MAMLAGAVALLAASLSASSGPAVNTEPIAREAFERPGLLAMLPDGRRLNFRCMGRGSPTVILESGFAADSSAWSRVEPRIAGATRVCAYDRAGSGFSDPGPLPRDGAAIARDLDNGLRAAGIVWPYVLVGHSAGGLYARLFAARRRDQVVGLVFVDSSVEHQMQRMQALFGPQAGGMEGLARRSQMCLKATAGPATAAHDAERLECAPPGMDAHARQVALRADTYRTQLSELDTLFTTTSDEVDRTGTLLQDVPAIVLTAAKGDGEPAAADDPGAAAWQNFHLSLAEHFRRGRHRLVKSSHLMMLDRPEVVAGAALELVQAARRR
jgi:pimeloyl-ACP methyl ester carboxylesterase